MQKMVAGNVPEIVGQAHPVMEKNVQAQVKVDNFNTL